MIPKIIHFTVPREITAAQSEAIRVARKIHPDWEIKVWQDPIDPAGFLLAPFWKDANSGAQLADLIRLDVVNRYGGVYLDSDMRVLKPLDPIVEHCDFFVCSEDGIRATNAVFGAVPGHPAVAQMIKDLREFPPNWTVPPNYTTGPEFFARSLKWRTDITVLPRLAFYPYNWDEVPRAGHPHSYAVHQWAGSWKTHRRGTGIRRAIGKLRPRRLVGRAFDRYQRFKRTNEWAIRLLAPVVYGYSSCEILMRQTVHGHGILLDGVDVSLTPEIYCNGYYELREELFVGRALKGGDVFIDVGANIGVFSLLAASRVGPFGRVYAYEPNPTVADLLRRSAIMNWMHERLIVRVVAVGKAKGEAELTIPMVRLGDAALSGDKPGGALAEHALRYAGDAAEKRRIKVPIVSLDDEFPCDIPIRFLKIDAEGHETKVLAGANRLLKAGCIDFIMLEALENVAGSWKDFLASLAEIERFGYKPFVFGRKGRLDPTTLENIRIWGGGVSRNIVLKRTGAEV